jgi:hypothetical protein
MCSRANVSSGRESPRPKLMRSAQGLRHPEAPKSRVEDRGAVKTSCLFRILHVHVSSAGHYVDPASRRTGPLAESRSSMRFIQPAPYGHWRGWVAPFGDRLPDWLHHCDHCGEPMFLLGRRAAQAATQISESQRVDWLKLGARVAEEKGKKRWRPILNDARMCKAYPLV